MSTPHLLSVADLGLLPLNQVKSVVVVVSNHTTYSSFLVRVVEIYEQNSIVPL